MEDIQKDLSVILAIVETVNTRTLELKKDLNSLKYMLELKKSQQIKSNPQAMNEEEKKNYVVKQKQYLYKLNNGEIRLPKDTTLEWYNIDRDGEQFKLKE